ncbi:MAG: aldose epimerase [Prochlorothrix sp.]
MATVTVEQGQYQLYKLTDEATQTEVVVIPERGGIVTEWRVQGRDLFYLDRERLTDPKLSVRGGNPILFPICGNLPEDSYMVEGQSYTLVQHGFGRNLPWTVVDQSTEPLSLSVQLVSNDETRSGYPFDFVVTYTYVVQGGSLEVRQRYENTGDRPLPFSAGFHPYFEITDSEKSGLSYDFPVKQWQSKETGELLPFEGLDFSQDEIDMAFPGVTGSVATVTDPSRSLTVSVEYDTPFKTLVFWTVKGKDFYCLEPWSGPRNAMNTGTDLLTVAPGELFETWVRYRAVVG